MACSFVVRPPRERPIAWRPFWWAPRPVLMDLHARAVDRHPQRSVWLSLLELRLQFGALELGEDAFQDALVDPATSAHVHRVPGTEALG